MRNKPIVFIIILIAIFTAIYFGRGYFKKDIQSPEQKTEKWNEKIPYMDTYKATTTYTTIEMSYPKSSKTKYPEIFNFVNELRTNFEKDYASITTAEIKKMYSRDDVEFQMIMTTKIVTSEKTTSYIIQNYEDTGGAHGGTSVTTFTYDKSDKLVKIEDVLGVDYLKVVAPLAKEYVYKTFSDSSQPIMMDAGTEAVKDNFSAWYLTDDKIVFIFGQYQIGPYVLGIQEFPLEKSKVQSILNSNFK